MSACHQIPFVLSGSKIATGTAVYPLFQLLDSITLERPYTLNGLWLTSCNTPPVGVAGGIMVILGQNQPVVRLSPSLRILSTHLARGAALTTTFDRSSRLNFSARPLLIQAGEPVSLYGSGATAAFLQYFAACILHVVPQ